MFSAEFSFKDCCEQADFYNTISDSKSRDDNYSQGLKTYHEEVVVSEFVEDEEVTFLDTVVKEEFYDHYDNQVVVLSQVKDDSSDEINRDSLEYCHNSFNTLYNHLNANPIEDQSLVQQTVGNHCFVKDKTMY